MGGPAVREEAFGEQECGGILENQHIIQDSPTGTEPRNPTRTELGGAQEACDPPSFDKNQ